MRSKTIFWVLWSVFILAIYVQGQPSRWFDDQTIYTVVLLEKVQGDSLVSHGTGFLVYNYKNEACPTVVTCAHLLKRSEIYVVVTADSELVSYMEEKREHLITMGESNWILQGNKLRLHVDLQKGHTYVNHPDTSLDIAAFPIGLATSADIDEEHFKVTRTTMVPKSKIKLRSKSLLGDDVFFVGFPFGIGTMDILYPLVRSGIIAWLANESEEFLLDAFSYPGNSGSPVYTKIALGSSCPHLIGMIIGHLGTDFENFGLARCVWVDDILTVVRLAENL